MFIPYVCDLTIHTLNFLHDCDIIIIVTNRHLVKGKSLMGLWIFMLIVDLLIPFTMIAFGRYFIKKAPMEINSVFGYRTSMSMKNKDTWEFSHKFFGKLWFRCGLILLPLSVAPLLFVINNDKTTVGIVGSIVVDIQLIPLVGSIFPTEAALKKTFDQNGMRR